MWKKPEGCTFLNNCNGTWVTQCHKYLLYVEPGTRDQNFPGWSALFLERCIYHLFLEQPGKSALFPEKGAKLTTGKHESIFLEEVHFFVWFFPKKCTSSRKIYSNFGFWNSLLIIGVSKVMSSCHLHWMYQRSAAPFFQAQIRALGFGLIPCRLQSSWRRTRASTSCTRRPPASTSAWDELYKNRSSGKTDSQEEKRGPIVKQKFWLEKRLEKRLQKWL